MTQARATPTTTPPTNPPAPLSFNEAEYRAWKADPRNASFLRRSNRESASYRIRARVAEQRLAALDPDASTSRLRRTTEMKKGDLCMVFDPPRGDGGGSGTRGLHFIDHVTDDEAWVIPIDRTHTHARIQRSAVRIVFAATFVAEEFLK